MTVWSNLTIVAALVCVFWFVSEVALSRILHSDKRSATSKDKASLRTLWLTIVPATIIGSFLGGGRIGFVSVWSLGISWIGFALVFVGLIIRWSAILALKRYFTADVAVASGQKLVDTGLYAIVRHPSYSGAILSFIGLGLTFSSWVSTLVIAVPIFFAFHHRIKIEEQALTEFFGDAYVQYTHRVKRLIPLIY